MRPSLGPDNPGAPQHREKFERQRGNGSRVKPKFRGPPDEADGLNKQFGYKTPADLVDKHPQFYWHSVFPHTKDGIRYLNVTSNGRQWIANLYGNVFRTERHLHLSGPEP